MNITEFSERVKLPKKTLRYWEDIGVLPGPARTANGYRDYDEKDVKVVVFIKTAKTLGLTLREIKAVMKLKEKNITPCEYLYDLLVERSSKVEQAISDLVDLKKELDKLIKRANALDLKKCDDYQVCHIIPLTKINT